MHRCRTCEVACVVSHQENQDCAALTPQSFLPRIHVIKGVNVSTATACRQCEDAPCANVCPNGAISRDKGFVHVMQERCIGCKTCVVACPYGAMEVVVRPVVRHSGAGLNVMAEKPKPTSATCATSAIAVRPALKPARPTRWFASTATKLEQMNLENVAVRRWPGNTPHERGANPHTRQSAGVGSAPLSGNWRGKWRAAAMSVTTATACWSD